MTISGVRGAADGRRVSTSALVGLVVTLAVCAPIVVAAIRALRNDWAPLGDSALFVLRANDVLTSHHPWLGLWSSASLGLGVDVNHPGPLYFDLLAPFVRGGSGPGAAAVGVAAINVAAVAGTSWVAHRVGGLYFQLCVLGAAAAVVFSMGSELLIDVWQPHAMLLPFLLLVVLAVALGVRGPRWLPGFVAVASLVVQTHLGYVYVVGALGLTGLACARNTSPRRSWATPVTTAAAVALVCWAQPLWEQFTGAGRGNLGRLVSSIGAGASLGVEPAVRVSTRVFLQPPWHWRSRFGSLLVGHPGTTGVSGVLPIAFTAAWLGYVVVIAVVARAMSRRGRPDLAVAGWMCLALIAVSVLGTATLDVSATGLGLHQIRWMWVAGIFTVAVQLTSLAILAGRRWTPLRRARPALIGGAVAVGLAAAAVPYHLQAIGTYARPEAIPVVAEVLPTLASLDGRGPVLFDTSNIRPYEPYSGVVMYGLAAAGVDFRVDDAGWIRQLGAGRAATGTEPTAIFQLQDFDAVAYGGSACIVAAASSGTQVSVDDAPALLTELHGLAQRLNEGQLVDPGQLGGADLEAYQFAATGVLEAAIVVADGTLRRWYDGGMVELTMTELDAVIMAEQWVPGLYVLFAEGAACDLAPAD